MQSILQGKQIRKIKAVLPFNLSRGRGPYHSPRSPLFSQAIESKVEAEQKALKAENDLRRIEVEAKQREANAIGLANANIAEAKGEAEAIAIINKALSENPNYLEWLKTQAWDGKLPLVVGEGGTPFIQIPVNP